MKGNFTKEQIDRFGSVLNDTKCSFYKVPLKARFRALFILRNIGCDLSVKWISKCLHDDSALLKHELAYCLGQMQNETAVPILIDVLNDHDQEPIVRHEAAEALGAIGDMSAENVLTEFKKDPCQEVAETYPTPTASINDVAELWGTLVDISKSLWDRYCAMFKLRNINTEASIKALAQGLYCEDSALFRHEIAYVLGQIQSPLVVKELKDRLCLSSENCMVRHECAEALGAIATDECISILQQYVDDSERVVRESCEVALDMADYENAGEFNYAVVES
uniref:Deoxyhypusine hydroxylase n=1 Tax=Angiostrongylus cantonensis TaxID=6313 RepID=A0A0K0D919_ANGCA